MLFPGPTRLFLSVTAALFSLSLACAEEEPAELLQAKAQFQKEMDFALRPMRDRYVARLEILKRSLASKGDLRAAVTVQDEIDLVLAIANEASIRARLIGTWSGLFKDGPRRYVVKGDGTVDWLNPNGTPYITGHVLREGKDFIFSWEQIEETHRVSLTETGGMLLDFFSPKVTYPKGQPLYRITLARSASAK